jgi:hypothetical protein
MAIPECLEDLEATKRKKNALDVSSAKPDGSFGQTRRLIRADLKAISDIRMEPLSSKETPKQKQMKANQITVTIIMDNRNKAVSYLEHGKEQDFACNAMKGQ